ncbi:hypothetical protein ES705_13122 [subsurface metagenome]
MMKFLNILRISVFTIMILTSLPLVIHHFRGSNPEHDVITHLHVLFGLLFIVIAIISMVLNKKMQDRTQ